MLNALGMLLHGAETNWHLLPSGMFDSDCMSFTELAKRFGGFRLGFYCIPAYSVPNAVSRS